MTWSRIHSLETVRKGRNFCCSTIHSGLSLSVVARCWMPPRECGCCTNARTWILRASTRLKPSTCGRRHALSPFRPPPALARKPPGQLSSLISAERRKLGLGSCETMPDIAILDPELVATLPPRLTADTGLDALTHAVEGYTSSFHNDFCDGLCLRLPAWFSNTCPGLWQMAATWKPAPTPKTQPPLPGWVWQQHGSPGTWNGTCLGRCVSRSARAVAALFYPTRLNLPPEASRRLALPGTGAIPGLAASNQAESAASLAKAIRELAGSLGQPLTLAECGITADLEREMDLLVQNAMGDTQTIMSVRIPDDEEMKRLFLAAYDGTPIHF